MIQLLTLDDTEASQLISGTLAVLAIIQLMCTAAGTWQSAIEADIHVQVHHIQLPLGGLVMIMGVVHTIYCCTYFYIGFACWAGTFILIQAAVTWKCRRLGNGFSIPRFLLFCRSCRVRVMLLLVFYAVELKFQKI